MVAVTCCAGNSNESLIMNLKLRWSKRYDPNGTKEYHGKLFSFVSAKENVKTASYGGVILAGIGVLGLVLYNLWDELFSGNSPNSLFQV